MDVVEEARKYAFSEMEKTGSPDKILFEISEMKALELAERLGADKTIVHVGVCLMDIKLGQAKKEKRLVDHTQMGAAATREFLKQFDLNEEVKKKMVNCVEAHHRTIPTTSVEADICANADCYRFIHPKGFFRFLTILGTWGLSFEKCLQQAEEKLDEKYDILSLDIAKEELEPYYATLKKYLEDAKKFGVKE